MKNLKKVMAAIMALTMCASTLCGCGNIFSSEAADEKNGGKTEAETYKELVETSKLLYPAKTDDLRYNVYEDYVSISECITNLSFLVIPEEIEEKPVLRIDEYAFSNNAAVTSVVISKPVIEIGANAFKNCATLKTVEIQDSVQLIGKCAFDKCYSLTELIIPNTVSVIPDSLCNHCDNLASVTIKEGELNVSIESGAFRYCKNLRSIWIPSNVISLDENAFVGSSDNLTVYGCVASPAAQFASDNLTDFVILDYDEYFNIAQQSVENVAQENGDGASKTDATEDKVEYTEKIDDEKE